jgi:hypothetical protein
VRGGVWAGRSAQDMMRAVILCRVLFGYGPLGIKKLTVLEAGDGGIAEMTQHLSPDAVMFCFMQVDWSERTNARFAECAQYGPFTRSCAAP